MWAWLGDFTTVHCNRNFILSVFTLTRFHCKYLSHLKLVLTSSSNSYIQVRVKLIRIIMIQCMTWVQVLFKIVEEGSVDSVDDVKWLCEKLVDSKMQVCPGISAEEYESYKEVIRYDQKKVQISNDPIARISSVKCLLWFPIPRNICKTPEVVCSECATLKRNLRKAAKRLSFVTSVVKVKHQQPESTYPLKYLPLLASRYGKRT